MEKPAPHNTLQSCQYRAYSKPELSGSDRIFRREISPAQNQNMALLSHETENASQN
jgi:hypothetical protein